MKRYIFASLALFALSEVVVADSECSALGATAADAGLTSLVDTITVATPALQASEEGMALLAAVGITDELPIDEQVTVFAPNNAAFEAVLAALGPAATPDALADVLLNHVVVGSLTSDAVISALNADGGSVQLATLLGSELLVTGADGTIFVQSAGLEPPGASVVTPDVITCVGPVHVIDQVLLPTPPPPTQPSPAPGQMPAMAPGPGPAAAPEGACARVDVTATEAGLEALVNAITFAAPSLNQSVLDAISAAEPFPPDMRVTIFAPTDAAFEAAAEEFGGSLPEDPDVIAQVLLNHIVAGELSADDIVAAVGEGGGSIIVQSLLGSDLFVATFGPDLFVQSRGLLPLGAQVATADVPTCSGIVHVIDEVLLPTLPDGSVVNFTIPDMAPGGAPELGPMPVMAAPGPGPSDVAMPMPAVAQGLAPAPEPVMACVPLGVAATEAGLTSLVGAITAAAPTFMESIEGEAVLSAVSVTEPVPAAERVTVFAPTNEAFELAAAEFGGEIPPEAIPDVLLGHVVAGDLTAAAILAAVGEGGGSVEIVAQGGGELVVTTVGDALYVQSAGLEAPGALVATTDVITCAGPVHVLDAVLLPAFPDGSQADLGGEMAGVPPTQSRDLALPPTDGDDMEETPADLAGADDAETAVAADTDAASHTRLALWPTVAAAVACMCMYAA